MSGGRTDGGVGFVGQTQRLGAGDAGAEDLDGQCRKKVPAGFGPDVAAVAVASLERGPLVVADHGCQSCRRAT